MKTTRLNTRPAFSGILRFLNFDMLTGVSMVMIGNAACAPIPIVKELSYEATMKVLYLRHPHGKKISENTHVVDRWVVQHIVDGKKL